MLLMELSSKFNENNAVSTGVQMLYYYTNGIANTVGAVNEQGDQRTKDTEYQKYQKLNSKH